MEPAQPTGAGAVVSTTIALPSPHDRHPQLSYGTHPEFGDFITSKSMDGWTQSRAFADGRPLLVLGSGPAPSQRQITLFQQVEGRLAELRAAAIDRVPPPPTEPPWNPFRRRRKYTRDELALREVRVEDDGSFELYFLTPTGDLIGLWPIVAFEGWRITSVEWAS